MARNWEARERRLVSEWTRLAFPNAHVKEIVRLGAIQPEMQDKNLSEKELRALGVFRRWVDALVIEPTVVHLVEGKIRNQPGALEQLDLYERLLPLTPELQDLRGRQIFKHLVWAIVDPVVESLARERGIWVHVYRPQWVDEYLSTINAREARARRADGLLNGTTGD